MTNTTIKTIIRTTLAASFALGAALVSTPEAEACGGGWWPEEQMIDHRIRGVEEAEKALEDGRYDMAAASVLRMIPHISGYTQMKTNDPIIHRAMRVLAVSTARTNGNLDVAKQTPTSLSHWSSADKDQRAENLLTAVAMMKVVAKVKTDDAVVEGELGETLAKLDSHRADGKAMLEKLAGKDLLASPEAFLTLAQLRKADGDDKGSKDALRQCELVATDASVCGSAAS